MVSRFPDGSPITGDGNAHVLAEFSRDVTKADLIDKVDVVFYDGPDVFEMKSLAAAQVEDENILVVKHPDTIATIELTIDGNKLITSESSGFFFDIDFDNQHRKFFEKSSGTYLMQLPNVIEQATPERYAVVRVTNVLEINGALSVAILINTNNEPWSGDAELSDIDVAAFFDDNIDLSSVEEIIKAVLKMEYDIPSGVTFNVVTTAEQSVSVDGGLWNLFTDGSAFVPLVMTSRFPNGAPVKTNGILATFNRPPYSYELSGVTKTVCSQPSPYGAFTGTITFSGGQLVVGGPGGSVNILIENNSIKISEDATNTVFYDIDFKEQNLRPLTLPSSIVPLMFECANPDFLDVGEDGLDIFMFNNLGAPSILVVTNDDGTMVKGSNGQLPPQDYQVNPNSVVDLLNKILEMEFSNYDDFTTDTEVYSDEPISGTVDLLTVSNLTPA